MSPEEMQEKFDFLQKATNERLLEACRRGAYWKAIKAIEEGANVNCLNDSDFSPIHYAVMLFHYDLITLLVNKGADINLKNKEGKTALELFYELKSMRGSLMIKLLKRYGAEEPPDIHKLAKQETVEVLVDRHPLIASPFNPVQTSSNIDRKDLNHDTV
jgi:ankyrin repeat protein